MFELSKQFRFDAAHTLQRKVDAEPSRRIHGHSYQAEVTLRGLPDPATGMVVDLGHVERALAALHEELDHRFLDEVEGLGPATLENLCAFIWGRLARDFPQLAAVAVGRDSSGDRCVYRGPAPGGAGQ
jgi:6-pyruvoyltetrahydropterin/6-carboxytetrahydropterin synthase